MFYAFLITGNFGWVMIVDWWVIDGNGDKWWVIIDEWWVIDGNGWWVMSYNW